MILWCKNNDKQVWNNYEQACRHPTAKSRHNKYNPQTFLDLGYAYCEWPPTS